MYPPQPSGRGRLVAAILISLAIHALVGYAWVTAWSKAPAAPPGINVAIDSPDDSELANNVREPRFTQRKVQPVLTEPGPLPKPITDGPPLTPTPFEGAPSQAGGSLPDNGSLPNSGGPKPLHGELKAGQTIVYLLDSSASMGIDGILPRAMGAVRASLEHLGPDTRFQIVAYNGGVKPFLSEPVAATPGTVDRAGRWLAALLPEGGSKHVAGFREAFASRPDIVYLLTDADGLDEADVRAVASLNRKPAVIMAAVFGGIRPAHETPLERLVRVTGGTIRYLDE
jgi:hypothetical protein